MIGTSRRGARDLKFDDRNTEGKLGTARLSVSGTDRSVMLFSDPMRHC